MIGRRIQCVLGLSAVALFLAGCGTTVAVQARFPANNPDAALLRKVAVADFDGPGGDIFAYSFESMVGSANFDGVRYFTLVDSGSRGHGSEARYAADYGRSVGADGVYFGRMETGNFDNFPFDREDTRCVEKNQEGKCVRRERFYTPCKRRTFHTVVLPALVNVRNGRVVYSARKEANAETSWCRGEGQPISDDSMAEGAVNRILADIRQDIAPYNTVLQATVIEKKDGLSETDGKSFDAAVKSAGKGDLSEACRLWGDINRANPNHPWTIYNLGVCSEANGDFAGALSRYENARTLAPAANRDVAESIGRVRNLIAAQQELRRVQKAGQKANPKPKK
jgi:hypothetical protein